MIIHKLIAHHLSNRDDPAFYRFQAEDAIGWIEKKSGPIARGTTALDLGCGHGIFGAELARRGCEVTFADYDNGLLPELRQARFLPVNLDQDDISRLGQYDLVICSNVLEHLAKPEQLLEHAATLLKPQGRLFLSWTNWLSPWGGHEFSPFHYLGARRGHLVYDRLVKRKRLHTPFENLFPTYIGQTLASLREHPHLRVTWVAPRYYPEFAFLMSIPVLREFLAWNCAVVMTRR
jgi:2-polyprenyl-3-methyl-5-hydroxy-6-metoxy-1,4-benzoquinol methylase